MIRTIQPVRFTCRPHLGAVLHGRRCYFSHTNVETRVWSGTGHQWRVSIATVPSGTTWSAPAQVPIPNPWGIAFDEWGQDFFAQHPFRPGSDLDDARNIRPRYGQASPLPANLIQEEHRVRPTSGLEFISSRHFPDEVQGDLIINNTINFWVPNRPL